MSQRYLWVFILSLLSNVLWASGGGGGNENSPYFEIPKPFVVNIQGDTGLNFLQVNAQLRISDPLLRSKLTQHLPAIQHVMMMVLSEQSVSEIRTVAGKQKLREQTLKEVQTLLEKEIGNPVVDEILFTGFIIQ